MDAYYGNKNSSQKWKRDGVTCVMMNSTLDSNDAWKKDKEKPEAERSSLLRQASVSQTDQKG